MRHGRAVKSEILLCVVADRIFVVVARAQPAVARTIVVFNAATLVRVIRIGMTTSLIIRRKAVGSMERPSRIGIPQSPLPPISAVIPAEEMIVGSVLHHHHNDVLDSRGVR